MAHAHVYSTYQQVDELTTRSYSLRHQDTRQALELCLLARDLSLKIDYQRGYAKSLYLIGLCHHILGMSEDVLETVQQALSLFESLGDETSQAEAYNLLGTIFMRQSDFTTAIEHQQKSLNMYHRIGDKEGEARVLNNIAIGLDEQARLSEAFEYLYKCLGVAQAIPSPSAASYALFNIAQIFIKIDDTEKALEYYQQGLNLNRGTDDHALESSILAEMGKAHALQEHHETAMAHLNRSLEITQQTGNIHDQGITLMNMGFAYQKNEQYLKAEEALNAALEIMISVHARADQSEILSMLGKNYAKQGRYDEALTLLHKSLQIAEEVNTNRYTWSAHNELADVYKTIGDFEQALSHYQVYHDLWKKYYSQDSEKRIHAIIASAEIEKARRDAEEQRLKSHELSQALTEAKRVEVETSRMLTQMETQSKILEQLTREDGLTGLSNRRWLDIQVNQEFERARRFNHPLSIVMIDVDNFKSVNDQFSHLIGDEVLRRVAGILRNSCRMMDGVGRFGGEEFMLVLVETSAENAREVCEKILENIRNFPWQTIHPHLQELTVSIGVSQNLGVDSPREMLAQADVQLYRAKQQGKDQVCLPAS